MNDCGQVEAINHFNNAEFSPTELSIFLLHEKLLFCKNTRKIKTTKLQLKNRCVERFHFKIT